LISGGWSFGSKLLGKHSLHRARWRRNFWRKKTIRGIGTRSRGGHSRLRKHCGVKTTERNPTYSRDSFEGKR